MTDKAQTYYFKLDVDNKDLDGPSWRVLECQVGQGMFVHCPKDPRYTSLNTDYNGKTLSEIREMFKDRTYYSWVFEENLCMPATIWQVVTVYNTEDQLNKWKAFKRGSVPEYSDNPLISRLKELTAELNDPRNDIEGIQLKDLPWADMATEEMLAYWNEG